MSDDALLWAREQVASQYRGSSTLTAEMNDAADELGAFVSATEMLGGTQ